MYSVNKNLFISINDSNKNGHGADIRECIDVLFEDFEPSVFQDKQVTPEQIYSTTVESILVSDIAILDASQTANIHSLDICVQYGICYILGKFIVFLYVENNSEGVPPISSEITPLSPLGPVKQYSDVPSRIKNLVAQWQNIRHKHNKAVYTRSHTKSQFFGVIGCSNDDLKSAIIHFAKEKDWLAQFYEGMATDFQIDNLIVHISQPSFVIFCLSPDIEVEIYVAIGIAIGMGVPFLILRKENSKIPLPSTVNGKESVINYKGIKDLRDKLQRKSDVFLSDDIYDHEGSTYQLILYRIEKHIKQRNNSKDYDSIGALLNSINLSVNPKLSKVHLLLGDLYRNKYHSDLNNDINLLYIAKNEYKKAHHISGNDQEYIDRIASIDNEIQLIELIDEHKYRDIRSLIFLIGKRIALEDYRLIREMLITEVERLMGDGDKINAISLIAVMQIHDKSERIKDLANDILGNTPEQVLLALYLAQEALEDKRKENELLLTESSKKDMRLHELEVERDGLRTHMEHSEAQQNLLIVENKRLDNELKRMLDQLVPKEEKALVDKNIKISEDYWALRDRIITTQNSGKRAVVTKMFDLDWAAYFPLKGTPSILRNGNTLVIYEGFELNYGDRILHKGQDLTYSRIQGF